MRRFSFLLLVVLCYSACKNDDDMTTLSTCPGRETYSLDFQPDFFEDKYLWLSEADGDIAFDEEVNTALPGLQFLNFENACEDRYTVSVGNYTTESGYYPEEFNQSIRIKEYDAVPNGSVIDLQNARSNGNVFAGFMPNWLIAIQNCPPVDSSLLHIVVDPSVPSPPTTPYYFQYYPEDSVLVLYTEEVRLTSAQGLMAFRNANTDEWLGAALNFREELPTDIAYANLSPLELRSTRLQWPANATDMELEVRWVHDMSGRHSTILALHEGTEDVEVPVPQDLAGPFILTAKWTDDHDHEVRYVMDSWPEELNIISALQGEVLRFEYPELEVSTDGLNIITAEGSLVSPEGFYAEREYVGEAKGGSQVIRFAPLSPMLESLNTEIRPLYEQGFNESSTLSLYYYPEMNASYSWYFRNILSELNDSETWLRSLAYERLILPFN